MIHIIYISIIVMLFYNVVRAYNLYNKKDKQLKKYKEINKLPHDLLSHYDKSYVNFYRWMVENGINDKIIKQFDKTFKYEY